MKRIMMSLILAVMASGGAFGAVGQEATPAVQDGPVLPVTFSTNMGDLSGTSWENGNACSVGRLNQDQSFRIFLEADFQIIVRDESGRVIAVEDAPDGIVEESVLEFSDDWYCRADINVRLPKAMFYAVYFNDVFVRAYEESDFPFEEGESLYIQFAG